MLALTLNVSSIARGACAPLAGRHGGRLAVRCRRGVLRRGGPENFDTTGKKFLRGHQITISRGVAKFATIYPGWYPQRTPHIHYKIRSPASARRPMSSSASSTSTRG